MASILRFLKTDDSVETHRPVLSEKQHATELKPIETSLGLNGCDVVRRTEFRVRKSCVCSFEIRLD